MAHRQWGYVVAGFQEYLRALFDGSAGAADHSKRALELACTAQALFRMRPDGGPRPIIAGSASAPFPEFPP